MAELQAMRRPREPGVLQDGRLRCWRQDGASATAAYEHHVHPMSTAAGAARCTELAHLTC
jgi:hypothetical protein